MTPVNALPWGVRVPAPDHARALLDEAERRNPGPWVAHSRNVARAAEAIARHDPALDPGVAHTLGLLHDVGRREGVTATRHTLDGYTYLSGLGFPDAARVCLTHSFPMPDRREAVTAAGAWDCTPDELAFVDAFLREAPVGDYDRLIQLCDALALPEGLCLLEVRFVDVVLRHGFNAFTVPRWRAYLALKDEFEGRIGLSIYRVLPGVAETTFGRAG